MKRCLRFDSVKRFTVLFLLVTFINGPAFAKDYLIKNATIYTAGKQEILTNTDIYVSDGFIMQVAKNIIPDANQQVINAKGKYVTPGLINAWTQIGLEEISAAAATVDHHTEFKGHSAAFNIADSINLYSTLIPHNRMNGLTRAIVAPSQGESILQGAGVTILLQSRTEEYIQANIAQFVTMGAAGAEVSGGSRASAFLLLKQALSEAEFLKNNRRLFPLGKPHQFNFSLADLDALAGVLERKIPLVASANRRSDILNLIKISKQFKIKLIIKDGAEAWMLARELALAEIPVLFDPMKNTPNAFESLAVKLQAAAILNKAGVKLMFTNHSSHNAYLVRQSAGNAVANGLDAHEAIKSMTTNVAESFAIKNYGRVELGMQADLVVWDGDPLEVTSNPDHVFIKGVEQPLQSRATRLRDRFWELENVQNKAYKK
jgi:imidazolonepropionase-like amidohydrolase